MNATFNSASSADKLLHLSSGFCTVGRRLLCGGNRDDALPFQRFQRFVVLGIFAFSCWTGEALATSPQAISPQAVRAWEETVSLPTYPWEDDINPKFWALEGGPRLSTTVHGSITYPYTMQDHLSRTKEDWEYRAVFLENEYLRVMCLPALGGRLHSVFDKASKAEMFHLNRVIKPGMIAMRGAWISGGVEWNAGPQGHTVTCLSPVDVRHGTLPDGAGYLEISNQEKIFRTRWTVRLILRPGRYFLEEHIRLENPTDGVHPYYFWNCTAFPNRPGTRFIYPMSLGMDHSGREFFRWPVHEGRDLSWLKNHETWASVFAYRCTFDFFGAYDVEADRGIVQVANHHELPGKKAWTWGTWEFGLVAQQNLTDEDGPYIEVQSGPLPTQSDYGMLLPRQQISWREWWYPVHGLGDGFEFATREAVAQTYRRDGRLEVRLLATAVYPQARCQIRAEDGTVHADVTVDLRPEQTQVLRIDGLGDKPARIALSTAEGRKLLEYTTPLKIPHVDPPDPAIFAEKPDEEKSAEELFLKGRRLDRDTNRLQARRYYELALARDPGYTAALRALAVLDMEAAQYSSAAEWLEKALLRDGDDGLSWYWLGVCRLHLGDFAEALRCGFEAARCFGTRSLGYDLAGRACMRTRRFGQAVDLFTRAVRLNPDDAQAEMHLQLAHWAAGQKELAAKRAEALATQRPTLLLPQALLELARSQSTQQRAADPAGSQVGETNTQDPLVAWAKEVRRWCGEYHFNMQEAGLTAAQLGLYELAARVVQAACYDACIPEERDPVSLYSLAYLWAAAGREVRVPALLREAGERRSDLVFASRPEELPVLRWVIERNPHDAYAHYQLGNLLANLGQVEAAEEAWRRAVGLDPRMSVPWRNLGLAAAKRSELEQAVRYYERAIEARPSDQTLYRDLAEILIAAGKRPEAITVLERMPYEGMRRADVIILLAQAYYDEKQYTDVIQLLEATPYFVNWEGQDITWRLFHQARVERGIQAFERGDYSAALSDFEAALTYPQNLGVGRSNRPPEARAQYWRGKTLAAMGRVTEAQSAWKAGASLPSGTPAQNRYRELCQKALDTGAAD